MLEHYEQSAKKYIELLEDSDHEEDHNSKIDCTKIEEKLFKAKKRIEELNQMQKK